jgi:NhaA family Na+:H+ antiporter
VAWLAINAGPVDAGCGQAGCSFTTAMLCGIGFTMSLFIRFLAFGSSEQQNIAKVGVPTGSIPPAVVGPRILRMANPKRA